MPIETRMVRHCDACRELDHDRCESIYATVVTERETGYSYATSCCCTRQERVYNLAEIDDTSAAFALQAAAGLPGPAVSTDPSSSVAADASSGSVPDHDNHPRGTAA